MNIKGVLRNRCLGSNFKDSIELCVVCGRNVGRTGVKVVRRVVDISRGCHLTEVCHKENV